MSRILRRPMFRGGPTNRMTGIMSGIQDRQNYQDAGRVGELTKENLDLLMQNAPQSVKDYDPLTTFLLQYGPALASARPTGSLIGTAVGAAAGPIQSMLAEQAERRKYLRDLKAGATQLAIEQAGKERLLEKEIAGRKDIEGMKQEVNPLYASILEEDLGVYPGLPQVAQRAATFKTTKADDLYKKVGSRAGGVLTFDISDPKQVKDNKKTIKELNGKFVYDPYANNYKKIIVEKGVIGKPKEYMDIDSIDLTETDTGGAETGKIERVETNPSYMRPPKPDIITPFIKKYMKGTEEQEGEFGTGA